MDDSGLPVFTQVIFDWFNRTPLYGTLVMCSLADFLTGIVSGIRRKKIDSAIGFWGVTKKAGVWAFIGLMNLLDQVQPIPVSRIVTLGYIGWELLSVAENLAILGVPMPRVLIESFAKMKKVVGLPEQEIEKGDLHIHIGTGSIEERNRLVEDAIKSALSRKGGQDAEGNPTEKA